MLHDNRRICNLFLLLGYSHRVQVLSVQTTTTKYRTTSSLVTTVTVCSTIIQEHEQFPLWWLSNFFMSNFFRYRVFSIISCSVFFMPRHHYRMFHFFVPSKFRHVFNFLHVKCWSLLGVWLSSIGYHLRMFNFLHVNWWLLQSTQLSPCQVTIITSLKMSSCQMSITRCSTFFMSTDECYRALNFLHVKWLLS